MALDTSPAVISITSAARMSTVSPDELLKNAVKLPSISVSAHAWARTWPPRFSVNMTWRGPVPVLPLTALAA